MNPAPRYHRALWPLAVATVMMVWLTACKASPDTTPTATPAAMPTPVINLPGVGGQPTPGGPVPTPKPIVHVVASGENLTVIASDYGVTLDALLTLNHIKDPNMIWIGQQLLIPAGSKPIPTTSFVATASPAVAAGPQATQAPQPPGTSCILDSAFVDDVSVPDNTALQPGTDFVKVWRIRNAGNCDWPDGVNLTFIDGSQMSAPARVSVPATTVGSTVDVSVSMKAPANAGIYTGVWRLQTPDGAPFGIKPYVRIVVPAPQVAAAPPVPQTGGPQPSVISGVTSTSRKIFLAGQKLGNRADVFSKVGDSITFAGYFLYDIGQGHAAWGSYGNLKPVAGYFSNTTARTSNSFANGSLAAYPGWESGDPLDPSKADPSCNGHSALVCEYSAVKPSVAIIMLGTNDSTGHVNLDDFRAHMEDVVNKTVEMGVIPVLTTVPWNSYNDTQSYNAIIVEIARAHDIPLINYWAAMERIPNHGVGGDGVHPTLSPDGNPADFSQESLQYGYNLRNLVTLQMLDALWRQVLAY